MGPSSVWTTARSAMVLASSVWRCSNSRRALFWRLMLVFQQDTFCGAHSVWSSRVILPPLARKAPT